MNLLVVGSGGREHALVEKLSQSSLCDKIYCAPGNAGIAGIAECLDIDAMDIDALCEFAKNNMIGLSVIGPEAPLVAGIVDKFESEGLKIFGPSQACARFEGSKAYTKEFLFRNNIPTAYYREAKTHEEALEALKKFTYPMVVKADGLAAGKGVIICQSEEEAKEALSQILVEKVFGDAGSSVVLEEYLNGVETSCLCFVDGAALVPMSSSKDYKRIGDNDTGANTGGMGTYSPNPLIDEKMAAKINDSILAPIMQGFKNEHINYKGVLYVGLMICDGHPKVLEFNVRFGDPETQVLMLRLKSDLVKIMLNCTDGVLKPSDVEWYDNSAVCVVLASGGYPAAYERGKIISGLESVRDAQVLHAGTAFDEAGNVVTNGGRVLGVCASADTLEQARVKAYAEAENISFEGMQKRSDIGVIK